MGGAKRYPTTGFIFALKDTWDLAPIVDSSGLQNVVRKHFVPQLELLNDPRVIAFVSHAGGNSIIESMYYGKPLICAPISADQPGASFRV